MCQNCYEKYGSPKIDSPNVRELAKAIENVYGFSAVGGALHVAVDDWNLDCFEWCKENIDSWCEEFSKREGEEVSDEERQVYRRCADLALSMTEAEVASALALYDGYWKLPTVTATRILRESFKVDTDSPLLSRPEFIMNNWPKIGDGWECKTVNIAPAEKSDEWDVDWVFEKQVPITSPAASSGQG